ncbi:hypothetical protein ACLBYD_27135 [Rhodococcus sp. C26F]
MTPDEIADRGREIGRARWGKPLPNKAIELLTLYARQANEETIQEKAAS